MAPFYAYIIFLLWLYNDILGQISRRSFNDGDQLTYAAVKSPKYHEHFLTFCPSYAFVDRSTGYFNRAMGYDREYAAILSILWDIGRIIDNYVDNPCETTYNQLLKAGLPTPMDVFPQDDATSEKESNLYWDGEGTDPIFKFKGN